MNIISKIPTFEKKIKSILPESRYLISENKIEKVIVCDIINYEQEKNKALER